MSDAKLLPLRNDAADRRVAQLEAALMRRNEQLEELHASMATVYSSHAFRFARLLEKIGGKLLPRHSRRRRAVRTFLRTVARGVQTVSGRNPANLADGAEADFVALDSVQYARWIRKHEPTPADLNRQRATVLPRRPLISVIVPVHNPPQTFLEQMIVSVREQTYVHWELCVVDGGSTAPHVRSVLEGAAEADPRIRVEFLPANRGIAGNTNATLELATGDFVAFLDHDDTLAPFALFEIARVINEQPDTDFIYSDEDKLDEAGRRVDPCFKPDWSPDTLRGHNYVCHLLVLRRSLVEHVGGLREGFDGAQDYDLVLRASEKARHIVHVSKVLYHWRMHRHSTAADTDSKQYLVEAGRRALGQHLHRMNTPAAVHDGPSPGLYRVVYHLPHQPLVSVLIPNRDSPELLNRCLESLALSSYANYEVLVLENGSSRDDTFDFYCGLEKQPRVRILTWKRPFNYAAVNNCGATNARGDLLLFLNNDVEATHPDWLERMATHALRPEIGAVGAKLLYADGTVQHAGLVLGMGGAAGHVHRRFPRDAGGYMDRLRLVNNCMAVTGACLMTRRQVFEEAGGFDERFVLAYNDVDLCLTIRGLGYRILWTPEAELYHLESKTRGYEDDSDKQARFRREFDLFLKKWAATLEAGDPYFNRNFRLDRADWCLRA